jgi:uncharacterized protein
LATIQSVPEMYEWFINEWIHLVAINPETKKLHYFKEGKFSEYIPITDRLDLFDNFHTRIETATEMETNQIEDATRENLPVYVIN